MLLVWVCLFVFETGSYYVALDAVELIMQTRLPETHRDFSKIY